MPCQELIPSDPNDPQSLQLTSELRAVGSVVRATCGNKTVAILECQANLMWNGTLPSCSESDGDLSNLSSILIIVWVIGGVLLFTLIVLIAIIIGSRTKPVRRVNGQPPTEVFHISGQGEGGDNPAFSRSEERCGSSTRLTSPNSNTRLPSYQEAIRGLYSGRPSPSAPSSSSSSSSITSTSTSSPSEPYFIRANAPPSYRSSHLYRATNIQTSPQTTASSINELPPTTNRDSNRQRSASGQGSSSSSPFPRPPTPGVTRSSTTQNAGGIRSSQRQQQQQQQQQQPSGRYAESYPQCLWEEDPPPPYTPGPNNIHLYRSPVRTSQSRPAIRRSLTSRRPAPPTPPTSQPPPPTSSAPENVNQTSTQQQQQHHQHHHRHNQASSQPAVASVEHPLITYSVPCSTTNGTSGHFSTIQVINDRLDSQRNNSNNFHSLPFPPIHPVNPNSSLHSMLPGLPHNQMMGPPLSSSTPVPVRRDINNPQPSAPLNHVPLPPPPPPSHNTIDNRQHSRSQSHGGDPRTQNIPTQPRPLPRPRPQPSVHHQRQQSAPLARLEVEYF